MTLNPDFVKPAYNARCFADLPQTISYFLTGQGGPSLAPDLLEGFDRQYETVILFLIDAFGWNFFEKYCGRYPFLKEINQHGAARQLTSQFPSTTTAHVTCMHTGLPVGQSGLNRLLTWAAGSMQGITGAHSPVGGRIARPPVLRDRSR